MTPISIRIQLDAAGSHYQPGERLAGRFMVEGMQMRTVKAAELSILWYTAGKGDEDMAVHHFERLVDEPARPLDLRVPHRFSTVLPSSPLSYDGHIVKVCWCVRVRLFLPQAQEAVAEIPFQLGNVSSELVTLGDLGTTTDDEPVISK